MVMVWRWCGYGVEVVLLECGCARCGNGGVRVWWCVARVVCGYGGGGSGGVWRGRCDDGGVARVWGVWLVCVVVALVAVVLVGCCQGVGVVLIVCVCVCVYGMCTVCVLC